MHMRVFSILECRDDVDRKFTVHFWRVEQIRKNVLNHSISKKNWFLLSNSPLKTIQMIC